jgi:hypothetical protein
LNFLAAGRDQGRAALRGRSFFGDIFFMESIRPDNSEPLPLRTSPHGVGTLLIRFVGLLVAAIAVMALIWSR